MTRLTGAPGLRLTFPDGQHWSKMTLYSYPITIEEEGKRYYAYSDDFQACTASAKL